MPTKDIYTTQEAAKMLGISVTSVQQLVEAGVIKAWKTKGGHRRIPLSAVQEYKTSPGYVVDNQFARHEQQNDKLSILIIEDDEIQRSVYEAHISSWNLDAEQRFCENGYQALIEVARHRPDIVLADIVMEGIDGYEVMSTILADPQLIDVNIAVLSGLAPDELTSRGGIPERVVFFAKPINFDELRGYLRACAAVKAQRKAR